MDLLDWVIVVTIGIALVFAYLSIFTDSFDTYGNYTLQEANEKMSSLKEGTIVCTWYGEDKECYTVHDKVDDTNR